MTIAIIDDHVMIAQMLRRMLAGITEEENIQTYSNGDDFLIHLHFGKLPVPDVVITDIVMPGLSGEEFIQKLVSFRASRNAAMKVIALSSIADMDFIKSITAAGINGYLSKESAAEEIFEAINTVVNGGYYISNNLESDLMAGMLNENDKPASLSPREKDLLLEVCAGRTLPEASEILGLSINTAKSYYKNIMRKFKVNRTAELVLIAVKKGIYKP